MCACYYLTVLSQSVVIHTYGASDSFAFLVTRFLPSTFQKLDLFCYQSVHVTYRVRLLVQCADKGVTAQHLSCHTARTVYRQVCHSTSLIVSHCSYSVQTSVSQHITYRVTLLVQCTDKCVRTSRMNAGSSRNSGAVHALISAVFCCTSVDICEPAATSLKCVNNAHVPFQTADGGTSIPVQI